MCSTNPPAWPRNWSSSPRPTISSCTSPKALHHPGQRLEQDRHALARLVVAAQEQHRLARPRIPVQQRRRGQRSHVDPVGDLHRVGPQRLHLPAPGQVGHRDAADDLLVPGPQQALEDRQRQRFGGRGVKRRHDRALGHPQGPHRQAGRIRFVQVQHVEVAVGQPAPDPAVHRRAELQPRHRPVVGNRDGPAGRDDVLGQHDVRRRRRQHADLVPAGAHHLGQLQAHVTAPRPARRTSTDRPSRSASGFPQPGLSGIGQIGQPLRLQHVPVGGMGGDVRARTGRPAPG